MVPTSISLLVLLQMKLLDLVDQNKFDFSICPTNIWCLIDVIQILEAEPYNGVTITVSGSNYLMPSQAEPLN